MPQNQTERKPIHKTNVHNKTIKRDGRKEWRLSNETFDIIPIYRFKIIF